VEGKQNEMRTVLHKFVLEIRRNFTELKERYASDRGDPKRSFSRN